MKRRREDNNSHNYGQQLSRRKQRVRFGDYFRDRLAGLNAGENWGTIELENKVWRSR
jgi:hypothetical protein